MKSTHFIEQFLSVNPRNIQFKVNPTFKYTRRMSYVQSNLMRGIFQRAGLAWDGVAVGRHFMHSTFYPAVCPCIQRFIGCYKYIIRDKYVPSSFQSNYIPSNPSSTLTHTHTHMRGYKCMYKSLPEHSPFLTKKGKKRKNRGRERKEMVSNKSVQRTVACAGGGGVWWVVDQDRGAHRLSPRWNALVDWHSMLRLKGLMYRHPGW